MIDRKKQFITQKFSEKHRGVDLRCYDFENKHLQPIIAPERMIITAISGGGVYDRFGNDYLCAHGKESGYDLIFVHIDFVRQFEIDEILEKHEIIGMSQIFQEIGRGNSYAHHLHFETWKNEPINPEIYFAKMGIKYE